MAKLRRRHAAAILIFALLLATAAGGLYYFYIRDGDSAQKLENQQQVTKSGQQALVEADDFSYPLPTGWAALSADVLVNESAVSGIARPAAPGAKFTVTVEPQATTPKTDTEINQSITEAITRFSGFKLISQNQATVDNHSGHQYTYSFDVEDGRIRQQLTVVVFNNQAYSLLFAAAEPDFDKQSKDFNQIFTGFKFK